uniref:Uncharacterized protein AlNc14C105G6168 n=1 Tax=Albugo laibachii Nc14 TaxID=890382 RepID=F0WHW0_9STRA|nr:conserved hypothetical protein [Albugo laibachii Nc14]|eukprot:CCA20836.1 conserved hypothetical protein [Albugo laibachii Nc14]
MAEEYRQRLDNNVEKIVENFKEIIRTSQIRDKTNTSREGFQNHIHVTTVVQATESLLKLIAEIKMAVALGDFEGMNQTIDSRIDEYSKRRDEVNTQIRHLKSDVSSALFELESHYYQSEWRTLP